jgi:hypothetical protein
MSNCTAAPHQEGEPSRRLIPELHFSNSNFAEVETVPGNLLIQKEKDVFSILNFQRIFPRRGGGRSVSCPLLTVGQFWM